jgi:hypothetical protein
MAFTYSRYLRLRLDSNLTANARYNLEKLDLLGATFIVDSTSALNVRAEGNITIQPNSADLGGTGDGGNLSIGSASQPLDSLSVYADSVSFSSPLGLTDQAVGGSASLRLKYDSTLSGSVDPTDRILSFDLQGANRSVILGGDLETSGGALALTLAGATALTLPLTGTVSTLAGSESFTNKSMSGLLNSFSDLQSTQLYASNSPSSGQVPAYSGSPGQFTWITPSGGGGSGDVSSYTTTWLTSDGNSKVVTHGLGSSAVLVHIYDESNQLIGINTTQIDDLNQLTLSASESPTSSWTVVVHA